MGSLQPVHSTGFGAGLCSIPRIVRGSLVHQVAGVAFTDLRRAVCAWSAAQALRFDIADQLDDLTVQRAVALVEMRRAGDDFTAFSAASKREAHLAAQIRQLRRVGGAS